MFLIGISSKDALAADYQEDYFNVFTYGLPYQATLTPFQKLFKNNPGLQFNNKENTKTLGEVIFKTDKIGGNKPAFAFIVMQNLLRNTYVVEGLSEMGKKSLHNDKAKDTSEEIIK